eukprot:jgi/Galph1/2130/GphlegSOOS_G788.1
MHRKPAELNWTQLYRRLHKKGQQEEVHRRRRTRKVTSVPKPVEGASLEVIKAKRSQRLEVRKSAKEAALKEIKERSGAKKGKKATTAPLSSKPSQALKPAKTPAQQRKR